VNLLLLSSYPQNSLRVILSGESLAEVKFFLGEIGGWSVGRFFGSLFLVCIVMRFLYNLILWRIQVLKFVKGPDLGKRAS
jgi:hypothetical protein